RVYHLLYFSFLQSSSIPAFYTLSLHDALPIYRVGFGEFPRVGSPVHPVDGADPGAEERAGPELRAEDQRRGRAIGEEVRASAERSEEHTSELQSRFDLVCRLLLEKKKAYICYE